MAVNNIRNAIRHPTQDKISVVMKEFKNGALHSGSGAIVHNPKQAIAIALSEARKRR